MALYCYWEGGLNEGNYVCFEVEDEISIPPPDPVEGETDEGATVTLPGGSSADATSLSYARTGAKKIVWQRKPWRCLWVARSDGQLVSMTYNKKEDVWAWARHPMSNGAVVDLAVIPAADGVQDEVWAVIRRTIGDETVHYMERMTPRIYPESITDKSSYNYLDASLSYSGSATDTFSNADHLNGQECAVWADGAKHPNVTPSGGTFTLNYEAEEVKIGIHTNSILVALPAAPLATDRQVISEIALKFIDTIGAKAGPSESQADLVIMRGTEDPMDTSPPMRAGVHKLSGMGGGWTDENVYVVLQDTPGPMTLTMAVPTYKSAGK